MKRIYKVFEPFILVMVLMVVVSIAISIVPFVYMKMTMNDLSSQDIQLFYSQLIEQSSFLVIATFITQLVNAIVFIIIYNRKKEYDELVSSEASDEWISIRTVGFFLFYGFGTQVALSMLLDWILPFFPQILQDYRNLLESMAIGRGVMPFIATVVLAPIAEELVFRGLTLNYGMKCFPFWVANIIQAVLFGIYHQNIVQFFYATIMGILFGIAYIKYRNILVCILFHAFVNLAGNVLAACNTLLNSLDYLNKLIIVLGIAAFLLCSVYVLKREQNDLIKNRS